MATDRPAWNRLQQDSDCQRRHADAEHVACRLGRKPSLACQQQRINEIDCDRPDVLDGDDNAVSRRGMLFDAEDEIGRFFHWSAGERPGAMPLPRFGCAAATAIKCRRRSIVLPPRRDARAKRNSSDYSPPNYQLYQRTSAQI